MLLEFASIAPTAAADGLLARFTPALRILHEQLGTPYQDTVAGVLAAAPPPDAEAERIAAALTESGPPAELVGLEPFPTGR